VVALHSLDPVVASELTFLPGAELARRLRERGVAAEGAGEWDEDINLHAALPALATTRAWPVGGSVRPLVAITRLSGELQPVRALFAQMEDVRAASLPPRTEADAPGVVGIALPATIAAAAAVFPAFATEEARGMLAEAPENLAWRLWTARVRRRIASEDGLWRHWLALGAALQWAQDRGEWLALCR
jgi:hypothetical protein